MSQPAILVVEDDILDLRLLVEVLNRNRFRYVIATNGATAKMFYPLQDWAAVLLNLKLPDIDGAELIPWILQRSPDQLICIVTGYDAEDAKQELTAHGASVYIFRKPYKESDNAVLLSILRMRIDAIARRASIGLRQPSKEEQEPEPEEESPPVNSWRTTLCGAIGICAGAIVAADFGPLVTKIAGCAALAANGVGLLFARDERAAAKKWRESTGDTELIKKLKGTR